MVTLRPDQSHLGIAHQRGVVSAMESWVNLVKRLKLKVFIGTISVVTERDMSWSGLRQDLNVSYFTEDPLLFTFKFAIRTSVKVKIKIEIKIKLFGDSLNNFGLWQLGN